MTRWLIPLIAAAGAAALTGCVAYTPYGDQAYYGGGYDGRAYRERGHDRDHDRGVRGERDNDGGPNRYDRGADDSRRY